MPQSIVTCAFLAALSAGVLIMGLVCAGSQRTLDVHLCDGHANHRTCIESRLSEAEMMQQASMKTRDTAHCADATSKHETRDTANYADATSKLEDKRHYSTQVPGRSLSRVLIEPNPV